MKYNVNRIQPSFNKCNSRCFKSILLDRCPLSRQCDGLTAFDLNDHSVMNNHVVTLDAAVVGRSYPLMGFWVPQGGSCVIPANPEHRALYLLLISAVAPSWSIRLTLISIWYTTYRVVRITSRKNIAVLTIGTGSAWLLR